MDYGNNKITQQSLKKKKKKKKILSGTLHGRRIRRRRRGRRESESVDSCTLNIDDDTATTSFGERSQSRLEQLSAHTYTGILYVCIFMCFTRGGIETQA